MDKLFFSKDRAWVGEYWVGRSPKDAISMIDIPDVNDSRWVVGKPEIPGVPVLTLSPFYPSGRLGACVEIKRMERPIMQPNHVPFHGCQKWMLLDELKGQAEVLIPDPENDLKSEDEQEDAPAP